VGVADDFKKTLETGRNRKKGREGRAQRSALKKVRGKRGGGEHVEKSTKSFVDLGEEDRERSAVVVKITLFKKKRKLGWANTSGNRWTTGANKGRKRVKTT